MWISVVELARVRVWVGLRLAMCIKLKECRDAFYYIGAR